MLSLIPLCGAKMLVHFVKTEVKAKYIFMEIISPPFPHPPPTYQAMYLSVEGILL